MKLVQIPISSFSPLLRPHGFALGGLGGAAAVLLGLVVALTTRAQAQTVTITGTASAPESQSTQVTAAFNASGRLYSGQWGVGGRSTATYNAEDGPDYALGFTQIERKTLLHNRRTARFSGNPGTQNARHTQWVNVYNDNVDEPNETVIVWFWTYSLQGGSGSFTYTIEDDDPTIVSLARVGSATSINEGDKVEFTVTLGRALIAGETIDVPLSISGTGVTTGDWSLAKKSGAANTGVTLQNTSTATPKVRFSGAGAQTATLELTATSDGTADSGESFSIALGTDSAFDASSLGTNVGGGADPHSADNTFSVTVNDVYTLSIDLSQSSITEGNSGKNRNTSINYRLSAGRSAQFPFWACVDTASSTATHRAASGGKAADFNLIHFFSPYGSVNLNADSGKCHLYNYPANATNQNFRLSVFGDTTPEGNETAVVTIKRAPGTPSNVVLGTSSATLTINNDDVPTVTISGGTAVTEGTGAQFTVNASPSPTTNLTVDLTVADAGGSDFVAASNEGAKTVTIPAGQTSVTYTVPTTADAADELNGQVKVTVKGRQGYTVGSAGAATVRVTDDDAGFCDRTPQVRNAILRKIAGISNCSDVTASHLAAVTGTLDLNATGISSLKPGDFDGLAALTELELFFNNLTSLPAGVFDELTALTRLVLTRNKLTSLPAGVFDGLTALTRLVLSTNKLTSLPADVFDELTALTYLSLSKNSLAALPAGVFDSLTALEILYLSRNRLETLPEGVFVELTALKTLYLLANPGEPFTPTVDAGSDRTVVPGAAVSLSGAATGPWGDRVDWRWVQVDGAKSGTAATDGVTLTGATGATASFTAPPGEAALHFRLTATPQLDDPQAVSHSADWVTVTASPYVSFDSGSYSVTEGGNVSVTVNIDPPRTAPTEVSLAYSDADRGDGGTANRWNTIYDSVLRTGLGKDYEASPKSVTIPANAASHTFIVQTLDEPPGIAGSGRHRDVVVEPDETFTIAIDSLPDLVSTGANPTTTVTIRDNDGVADTTAPRVTSITRQTPSSSPTDADSLTWRVLFNEAVQNVNAADFQIGGTTAGLAVAQVGATNAYDVTASGGDLANLDATVTLTFASGQNIEDTSSNRLSNTTPIVANHNSFVVNNNASPPPPPVRPSPPVPSPVPPVPEVSITGGEPVSEGEDATFTLTATPAPATGSPVTVNLVLSARGEAVSSGETGNRSITIDDSGTATVTVRTEDDVVLQEEDGIVTATVQDGTGYTIDASNALASVTVRDDEMVQLSVSSLTVSTGDSASYAITLADQPMGEVTVAIAPGQVIGLDRSASNTAGNAVGLAVTSNRLLFTRSNWNVPQEVVVRVAEDTHDASLVLRHIVSGNGLNDKEDTRLPVAVVATRTTEVALEDAAEAAEGMEAWRLRFGRTVSQQVADALQDRLRSPLPLRPSSRLTVAGEAVSSPPALAENQGLLSKALGFENVSPQLLAEGSSFSFAPEGEGGAPQLAFWGQGAFSSFSGQEEELSLDGDVTTLLLGADWSATRWQAGAALSRSWGNGSYDGDNDADGEISATLTGLFPYGRYALTPRLDLWATAGYGWGTLSLNPDGNEEEYEPDTTMTMVAVGIDGLLLDGGSEGISLNTTADLLSLNTTSEEVEGLESSEGNVSRFRLGLEATRPFPLANGASLLPSMEVGIRQDSGDAETGFGMDLGAGVTWKDPERGISGELKGRTLLFHAEEDFQDQGLALSFSWKPSPSNRGPSLSMGHSMGLSTEEGIDALLNPTVLDRLDGLDASPSNGQQFKAELAYGFPAYNDRLTMIPAVATALSPTSRTYGLLWSVAPYSEQSHALPWEFSVEAERLEYFSSSTPADHSLKLNFSTLF